MRYFLQIILIAAMLVACEPTDRQNSAQPIGAKASNTPAHKSNPLPDYETARAVFWKTLYTGPVASLYCGESFKSSKRSGYNVEHVFPMSWATTGLKCGKRKQCRQRSKSFNRIEADLHNLFPARVDVNKERSSYRFGMVNGEKREFGECDFEIDYRARAVEPAEHVRGDVARAMFYMAHRYRDQGLVLFEKQAKLLLKWHEADPPSAEEARRNDVIERIQGNRNPFVDRPNRLTEMMRNGAFRR